MATTKAELKKQIEYYLSDKNLAADKFFNEKLSEHGHIEIDSILACNKVKKMNLKNGAADIITSIKDSTQVEATDDGKAIKRKGDAPVPALTSTGLSKKRDSKAQSKEETKGGKAEETKEEEGVLPQLDERGQFIFCNLDFESPIIVHFETKNTGEKDFKTSWKDAEAAVRKQFPHLKIVYSRSGAFEGDLAISSHRANSSELAKLNGAKLTFQAREFTFTQTKDEALKAFWQKEGGHFQFCIQPKLRNIKKQQKLARQKKEREADEDDGKGGKRQKASYEIAGVYYSDINKVKSKARAILNLKKDGESLSGNDADFIKELLAFHEKGPAKSKDLDHFEVGEHPDFAKTRCFFVVRKDGSREDFSISKCITKLDQQS